MTIEATAHADRSDSRAVLSALLDREPVDPDELARVLDDPDARALLVDFVRLRHAIAGDEGADAAASSPRLPARFNGGRRVLRPLAAAALIAGAGLGGLWLGERHDEERPPTPSRVVSYTPGVDWKETPDIQLREQP